jgi:hypothetical protein
MPHPVGSDHPERFLSVGYAIGSFGKWYLGREQGRLPNYQVFDEWYRIPRMSGAVLPDAVQAW